MNGYIHTYIQSWPGSRPHQPLERPLLRAVEEELDRRKPSLATFALTFTIQELHPRGLPHSNELLMPKAMIPSITQDAELLLVCLLDHDNVVGAAGAAWSTPSKMAGLPARVPISTWQAPLWAACADEKSEPEWQLAN